ncbi:fructosamine kinase family protein [Avibacterium paragallinarum]|uniref:fructosamine kinase family protein n=1 Tax=Avibacterium paragallinarum TaxID=728 RepID=UPI00034DCAE0|nr:fructosamine kinase family protein [Avibacterium paragallinarum]
MVHSNLNRFFSCYLGQPQKIYQLYYLLNFSHRFFGHYVKLAKKIIQQIKEQ